MRAGQGGWRDLRLLKPSVELDGGAGRAEAQILCEVTDVAYGGEHVGGPG